MKLFEDIAVLLAAACRAGSDAVVSGLTQTTKRACLALWLLGVALFLLLGALGLMIAALFIALTPHIGAHWAAMIAAAASLAGSGLFFVFARVASKMKSGRC